MLCFRCAFWMKTENYVMEREQQTKNMQNKNEKLVILYTNEKHK